MKLRQNARHFASRTALETPVVRSVAKSGLVRLHTRVFLRKADPEHADEREAHLDDLFEATVDTYLRALNDGYSEAEAREITHIQANFDFYNHGWTEMMEFPADELEAHYDRYREFFERWDITIDEPLGQFKPPEGLTEAPSTPEKLEDPVHPHAEGGFADDVYVETATGDLIVGGQDEPDDIDVSQAVGVSEETAVDADGSNDGAGSSGDGTSD
ncbi:uncharacterized protein Nmag_1255 [Natrialba magadii ATCC 43099]|uniref:Uncharacterized protein n=1 Tax=Natrialba magadii (strain ATCC 43099 / DSM 3394 / CCM 3739 / CIP 104546 / IAM 13178 / JCM 8861 / NBRC 102185 / NCIMB 2190 / MS3) TaxID=547559 RepID=D3SSB0_NATMM|nr:DUF6149 family protein [Natrialba magadii]ADD04836.1 uncharacterized protein Nmag_1255 [Natrialba magadii ATCC 43099]ELY24421.1 hypothetical protein C500_18800 [Natrialba magadii ATCC 43099]